MIDPNIRLIYYIEFAIRNRDPNNMWYLPILRSDLEVIKMGDKFLVGKQLTAKSMHKGLQKIVDDKGLDDGSI